MYVQYFFLDTPHKVKYCTLLLMFFALEDWIKLVIAMHVTSSLKLWLASVKALSTGADCNIVEYDRTAGQSMMAWGGVLKNIGYYVELTLYQILGQLAHDLNCPCEGRRQIF